MKASNPAASGRRTGWLYIGEALCIPVRVGGEPGEGYWYSVRFGDTWNTVARATGVEVRELWRANAGLLDDNLWLYVGQRIWVPRPNVAARGSATPLPAGNATALPRPGPAVTVTVVVTVVVTATPRPATPALAALPSPTPAATAIARTASPTRRATSTAAVTPPGAAAVTPAPTRPPPATRTPVATRTLTPAAPAATCLYDAIVAANELLDNWTHGGFEPAVAAYRAILDDETLVECSPGGRMKDEAATLRDFARYRLIVSYVALGRASSAQPLLDQIRHRALRGAADTFLKSYRANTSVIQACRDTTRYARATPDSWQFLADWGDNPGSAFTAADLCPIR